MMVDGRSPVEPTSPPSRPVDEVAVVGSVEVVSVEEPDGWRIDSNAGTTPVEAAAAAVVVGATTEDGIPAVEPTAAVVVSVVDVAASVVVSDVESVVGSAADELEAEIIVAGKPPVEPTAAA